MALKKALVITGLMIASTAAYAETLSAKIDFPFHAGKATYPAADYSFSIGNSSGGSTVITLYDRATHVSRIMLPLPVDTYAARGPAHVVFHCVDGSTCTLAKLQTPVGASWNFRQPKLTAAEQERIAVVTVPLHTTKAD
jgi:hypothetical protein